MWKRLAPLVLPLLGLGLTPFLMGAGCNKAPVTEPEDGNGTEPLSAITFDEQLACAVDCLSDYRKAWEALMHVLKKVDNPSYVLPSGIIVAVDTLHLDFSADLDLDGNGERDARLNGAIRPPPSNRNACSDGMHEHDVCVFEWMVTDLATLDSIAFGTYSAVHLGYTLPPNPRPAHRYTIVDRETEVMESNDCGLAIRGFDMMLDVDASDASSFYLDFLSYYAEGDEENDLEGWFAWSSGGDDPNAAALQLTVDGETHDCTFHLDSFGITCP